VTDDLWEYDRQVRRILRESQGVEEGRIALFNYLKHLEWKYRCREMDVHKLEYATAIEALRVFNNLISPRNEEIAGFSTLEYLWRLANGSLGSDDEPAPGFVEEFKHLLKAINGQAGLSEGWLGPVLADAGVEPVDFAAIKGRAAGVARSDFLDHANDEVMELVNRHPTGLDPDLVAKRERNRRRIVDFFDATLEHWYNHRWQLSTSSRAKRGSSVSSISYL